MANRKTNYSFEIFEERPGAPKAAPRPEFFDLQRTQVPQGGHAMMAARKKRQLKRRKKVMMRILILVLALAVLFSLAFAGIDVLQQRSRRSQAALEAFLPLQLPAALTPISATPADSATGSPTSPVLVGNGWNTATPLVADDRTIYAPSKHIYALPENGRVDRTFFNTAVFVGDSLTQGLQIYQQGLQNAQFCAYKGISPKQIYDGSIQTRLDGTREVPLDALVAHQPDNVYVLLGTNAMVNMDNESLLAYYSEMLDVMRERLPEAVNIYVQSITPVLQGVDPRFNFDDIAYLNDQLAMMAFEKGMYFLDLHEALAGDDGWLRQDFGAPRDGYHLTPDGYAAWVDYLCTHTAYDARFAHLYEENPAPYQQMPPEEAA